MRVTIEGLRRWILITGSLLLAMVAGFFIYGRSRLRHIEKDLPARLGVNIQQTATGWSLSQSSQGHTLFTLKASKLVQLRAGHALLHDVDITLYGPPGSGREDRIHGSDFDYNQNDGVATSQGDVEIELQGVGKRSPANSNNGSDTIRVKTSGLTFAQKSGEASTTRLVEFQLPRAAGSAVGADYNAKTGVVILNSQVHITTSSNGKPVTVGAGHATILRDSQQALLTNAVMNIRYGDRPRGSGDGLLPQRRDGREGGRAGAGTASHGQRRRMWKRRRQRFCSARRVSRWRRPWAAVCSSPRRDRTRRCGDRQRREPCCLAPEVRAHRQACGMRNSGRMCDSTSRQRDCGTIRAAGRRGRWRPGR